MRDATCSTWNILIGAAFTLLAGASARAADFVLPQSGYCTSNYTSPRSYGNHGALDIAGPNRSAVTAARAGTVTFYGWSGGYGNLMIVTHEAGYTTYYAHLSGAAVSSGTRVGVGQTIAYEGSTGNSTGPHVHFEVRRYGTKQYVPGSVGSYLHRGAAVAYDYAGIGDGGGQNGGSSPAAAPGGGSGATRAAWRVTASALNVRSGPSTGYGSIGLVASGQVYVSEETSNGWVKIWFGGRQGWSSGGYLARAGATVHEVAVDGLNVRSGPGTGYSVVRVAGRGQKYARSALSGEWARIFFDGAERWFYAPYTAARSY
jgi:uncharacterized protein YraI